MPLHGLRRASSSISSLTYAFSDSAFQQANLTTYSFTSMNFGTAATDRKIITAFSGGNVFRNVSSVTIGGVAATALATIKSTGGALTTAMYIADVPSGTSGTITVVWAGAMTACGIGCWSVYGMNSSTPLDISTAASISGTQSLTINKGDGFSLAAYGNYSSSSTNVTWTGDLSEDYEVLMNTTERPHGGASAVTTGSGTISSTATPNTGAYATLIMASFSNA